MMQWMTAGALVLFFGAVTVLGGCRPVAADDAAKKDTLPGDTSVYDEDETMEKATFAAGCFWGVEAAFRRVKGVEATSVGYTGGHEEQPTYKQVCSGTTGHAEAVEVVYDPEKVSYEDLLDVFWKNHDPTQVNRQGPDIGDQYRSAIFYHDEAQQKAAEESKAAIEESGKHSKPIATQIEPAKTFWRAEDYHQQYLEKRGLASCHI